MSIYQWLCSLFKKKSANQDDNQNISYSWDDKENPKLYNMGWQIYMKNGDVITRFYEEVKEDERAEIKSKIEKEIQSMEESLQLAISNQKTFVKLNNNILRLEDVIKICIYDVSVDSKV